MVEINFPRLVRISDDEVASRLVVLAKADKRGYSGEISWLIDQEWNRRQGVTTSEFHGPETLEEDVERRR